MGETHPPTLAGPEIAAPIGDTVAMFFAEIFDEHFLEYRALVLLDHVEQGMMVKKALAIYRKWHVMNRQPI